MDQVEENKTVRKPRHVFTVVERNGKSFWIKIGAAFTNYDGSESVILDALPVNGRMQIRLQGTKEAALKSKAAAGANPNGD